MAFTLTFEVPSSVSKIFLLIGGNQFHDWTALNDTIMGGSSNANCIYTNDGISLEGELVEDGGGFVSCRSPVLNNPFNLSSYQGFLLEVEGRGRTLKFAVACKKRNLSLSGMFTENLRWVSSVPTKKDGLTRVLIPFQQLEPTIRAKAVRLPLKFDPSCVNQFQILHSKFGQPGKMNPGFKPGSIKIFIRSISAYS